jgi:hypothetical protein
VSCQGEAPNGKPSRGNPQGETPKGKLPRGSSQGEAPNGNGELPGFALLRAGSREEAIGKTREFLEAAGDGKSKLLQVLDMPSPGRDPK